jgi:hypothetical protein
VLRDSYGLPSLGHRKYLNLDELKDSVSLTSIAYSDYNETYIYGTDGFCPNPISSKSCVTYRGSAYDASSSSTDKSISTRKDDGFKADWTEDTLSFGSNTSLSSFGFGVPQKDSPQGFYSTQAQLGLGRNSTFLGALASAGDIGTKAYSMFWGLVGGPADRQTQGSLVLGGLDKSLIADQNANFTGSLYYGRGCSTGMLITINDMLLNWPNGTDMSIFGGSQSAAMQACIKPNDVGLMSLPSSYYQNFAAVSRGIPPDGKDEARSFGINFYTMLFDPSSV